MQKMASKFKTIIFDIDGTMTDTFLPSIISLRKALFDVTGKLYTNDELIFHFGIPLDDALKQLKLDNNQFKSVYAKNNEYYNMESKNITFFQGIEELLESLSKKGVNLGIVTSQCADEYNQGLRKTSIAHYFKMVVCAEDTLKHKPDPEPIEYYIKKAGCLKDDVIYIGDTVYDSMSARGAGVKFGLATWGALDKNVKADYYFKTPSDILDVI